MVGLRGVGKTVLLDSIREAAEGSGIQTVRMEAPENRSLPALLAPELRGALLRLSRNQQAKELAQRGLRALAGFAKGLKILADNGDLEQDLPALLEAVARSAQSAGTALAMFIDELQYVDEAELAALITALHRCAQRQLPVVLVGAGLPQLRGRMGKAKSYAERLFEFPEVGPLPPDAAALAMTRPAEKEGIRFTPDAVHEIVRQTKGYPYFLQEWGKHAWDVATASPITFADVTVGAVSAIAALDASGEEIPAGHGRHWTWPASLGRHRRTPQPQGDGARSDAEPVDLEGHDLEPQPRRHGVHGAAVRRVHEAHHAR